MGINWDRCGECLVSLVDSRETVQNKLEEGEKCDAWVVFNKYFLMYKNMVWLLWLGLITLTFGNFLVR